MGWLPAYLLQALHSRYIFGVNQSSQEKVFIGNVPRKAEQGRDFGPKNPKTLSFVT
jgi:hypothetical protein